MSPVLQCLHEPLIGLAAHHEIFELVEGRARGRKRDDIAGHAVRLRKLHGLGKRGRVQDLRLARLIFRGSADGRFDLLRRRAAEDEQADMPADLRPKGVERDLLIVAARDQHELLVERVQTCDGPRRAGGDGVVIIFDAVLFPDELDAVLDAREAAGHSVDILVSGQTLDRAGGGHIVFDVVDAGDADIGGVHDRPAVPEDRPVLEINAVRGSCLPGEELHGAGSVRGEGAGDIVVVVQDDLAGPVLMCKDVFLGLDVFGHILMHVEVVGRDVRHDGDIRRAFHRHELEGAELEHRPVCARHFRRFVKQRRADVAAKVHGVALRAQELGRDGRGRGLAVAAGDGDHVAGTDLKEGLHLRGQDASSGHGGSDLRYVRPEAGGPEDDVLRPQAGGRLPDGHQGRRGRAAGPVRDLRRRAEGDRAGQRGIFQPGSAGAGLCLPDGGSCFGWDTLPPGIPMLPVEPPVGWNAINSIRRQ